MRLLCRLAHSGWHADPLPALGWQHALRDQGSAAQCGQAETTTVR
jgi:hypothetical protein